MSRSFSRASDQYLSKASAAVIAAPCTFSCWFRTTDATNLMWLMGCHDTAADNDGLAMYLSGSAAGNKLHCHARRLGSSSAISTASYSTSGGWQHACATMVSDTSRFAYLDGVQSPENTDSRAPIGIDNTSIGARVRTASSSQMNGEIAFAAIWDVALSADDVATLSKAFSPASVRPENIVSLVELLGGGNGDLITGEIFTATNGPTVSDNPRIIRPSAQILQFPPVAGGASAVLGLLTETDSVFALGKAKQKTLAQIAELDIAQSLGRDKTRAVGLLTESDIAQAFGKSKSAGLGFVSESDVSLALGRSKSKALGLLSETDQVFAITVGGALTVTLGLLTESDSPLALGKAKQKSIGLLSETDIAQSLGVDKAVALGLVSETDSLFAVSSAKAKALGLVTESDSVLSMTADKAYALGLVTEADLAFIVSTAKAANLGLLSETDTVFGITASGPAAPVPQAVRIVVEARNRRIVVEKRDRTTIASPRQRRIDVKKLN